MVKLIRLKDVKQVDMTNLGISCFNLRFGEKNRLKNRL